MEPGELQTEYVGRRGRLFGLALRTSLMTVLSLGLYRFWMKTRLRRFYWSAIRPGGHPLEYVGLPMEKLLGFLIAVVFLAFYIGIANLALMFVSLSLFGTSLWATALSFLGILPVLFYARYRARRYILARTRWRGIGFGLEPAAWGYAWRALAHWAVTILSLGLLWPRMTFWLEKYRTDRTWFGNARMHQGGRWQMLYRPFLVFLISLFGTAVVIAVAVASVPAGTVVPVGAGPLFGLAAVSVVACGFMHYRIQAFRLLTEHKRLGGLGFRARPRLWRVLRIYLFGYGLAGLAMLALGLALAIAVAIPFAGVPGIVPPGSPGEDPFAIASALPLWVSLALGAGAYFTLFVMWSVLRQVFVTLPLARHYAETLEIRNAGALSRLGRRAGEDAGHAEGFAEALDVEAAL